MLLYQGPYIDPIIYRGFDKILGGIEYEVKPWKHTHIQHRHMSIDGDLTSLNNSLIKVIVMEYFRYLLG